MEDLINLSFSTRELSAKCQKDFFASDFSCNFDADQIRPVNRSLYFNFLAI